MFFKGIFDPEPFPSRDVLTQHINGLAPANNSLLDKLAGFILDGFEVVGFGKNLRGHMVHQMIVGCCRSMIIEKKEILGLFAVASVTKDNTGFSKFG